MTDTEKETLIRLVMNVLTVQSDAPAAEEWKDNYKGVGEFGGVKIRVGFHAPMHRGNLPLVMVYGPSWEMQVRFPIGFPTHATTFPTTIRRGSSTSITVGGGIDAPNHTNTQLLARRVDGNRARYDQDMLYIRMSL